MNIAYMYVLLMLSVVSLYSADKDMQLSSDTKTCPHIIVHEGTPAVHTDIYNKLLSISRTLQDQVNDLDKPTPLTDKSYYPVSCNPLLLKHITNYITAQKTDTYLRTLSLIELVQLYQEADFWAIDTNILDTIRYCIVAQLRNADTLTQLFSSKENLSHFISACNSITRDTLTRALHSYTSHLLWYTTQTLTGHTEPIRTVKVHTDGTLFSCSDDCTTRIWKKDIQGIYHCTQTLKGHNNDVAVHPDGTLISGSSSRTLGVWKKNTQGIYEHVQTLFGNHYKAVNAVAVHPDGALFSCSDDEICVWKKDLQGTYHCVQTLTGHTGWIRSVAVHTDGTLFSGSGDKTVCVWKPDSQGIYKWVQTLTGHTNSVYSVAVHTDGTLFSGSSYNTILVWKPDAHGIYHCVQTFIGHHKSYCIRTLAVHTDDTLFVCSSDKTISILKLDAQGRYECAQSLAGHTDSINSVASHPDDTLFSGSCDGTIRVGKTLEENLSLEQHLLIHWLYNTYQSNGKTQLNTLSAHMISIYHTLPQSTKDRIMKWYKPEFI
ncbi:WD40 repeat domain-containing protein [Vermiphilus pyriformis]|nr:MAG: WD40 repeat domain-containing protein [Vermiphilus pyriformis]